MKFRRERLTGTMHTQEDRKINKNILIATTLSSFLVPFMSSAVNIAAPDIAKVLSSTLKS